MATRPIFIPNTTIKGLVEEKSISFEWHAGFAISQAQKSIQALHQEAKLLGFYPILEISSKSPERLGVQLSAFNLILQYKGQDFTVEAAYQGSKVFENGGPFTDIYSLTSKEAKQDLRLKSHGKLVRFNLFGLIWELEPTPSFYDWLYIQAVTQNKQLSNFLPQYSAFSDIVFNPVKSFSCQARAAAMYVALAKADKLGTGIGKPDKFRALYVTETGISQDGRAYEQSSLL